MLVEMTFLHVSAVLVNMLFNKEGRISIKNFYRLKGYIAQNLLKKNKNRSWNGEVFGGC